MLYSSYDHCLVHLHFDSDSESIEWGGRSVEINDNRSIQELDGRSVYELEGNTRQRAYTAYDPNYAQTSQGWRTELPTSHSTTHYGHHHLDTGRVHRISNPSHYPASRRDSYPLGEISSPRTQNSTLLGEIEHSRSDLMDYGMYSGGNVKPKAIQHNDNTSWFTRLNKKLEKNLSKYSEKGIKERIAKEALAKKYGYHSVSLTAREMRYLQGYDAKINKRK